VLTLDLILFFRFAFALLAVNQKNDGVCKVNAGYLVKCFVGSN
jgi:hypothetical protein